MSFNSLGLTPELVRVVAEEGYTEPTPVQLKAIPLVLAGRDLLAGAQTGTGKTAAFVLPLLQRLHATAPADWQAPQAQPSGRPGRTLLPARALAPIRALVLTPTRELALQVEESVRTYGRLRPVRSVAIYGGVGFEPQVRALRGGPAIVVATPGRLLDHVMQRTIDLSRVEVLILDEADRMLDMGFIRDIRRVLALLPETRQNLLFSATFSDEIRSLASGLLHDPAMVDVAPRNTAAELVDQLVIPVDRHRKVELLTELVASGRVSQALVFARTKHGANRLAQQLEAAGIRAAAIHGNKSQGQRIRALDDFKAGRVDLLVATDIAARGIDIDALQHVVNFELPMVASDYVHRIGRTGRAGVDGRAISLVCVDEHGLLREIQQLLRRTLPNEVIAGFEPDRSARPEPIRLRTGGGVRPTGRPSAVRPSVGARPAGGGRSAPAPWAPSARPATVHQGPARPGQGRPSQGRPGPGHAGVGRPGQLQGQARPGTSFGHAGSSFGNGPGRPAALPPRTPSHQPRQDEARRHSTPQERPTALPGERLSRADSGSAGPRGRG